MGRKIELWMFLWTIFWSLVIGAGSLPTTTPHTTPVVPREFPNFNQNYTFVDNSSIRANLASHSGIDTELGDLLGKDEEPTQQQKDVEPAPEEPPKEVSQPTKLDHEPLVPHPAESEQANLGLQSVVEWIEEEEDESTTTEDTKMVTSTTTTERSEGDEPYKDGVPIINGSLAGILVGVFLVICVAGYTVLILWRRSLEMKYGSREMLVDDDMFDPDNIKHFSL